MGPVALFDKSFIEALNPAEAVYFDHYFSVNVCPILFVETLADLEKHKEGRTPEQLVANLANKYPSLHGLPNVNHQSMCIGSLMGYDVKPDGRIVLPPGDRKVDGAKGHIHYPLSIEDEAMARWKQGQFMDIERAYAKFWRDAISHIDLEEIARQMNASGMDGVKCSTAAEAKAAAERMADRTDKPNELMQLMVAYFGITREVQKQIEYRWWRAGIPPLSQFAPYAHYCLSVELFLHFAVANRIITTSNVTSRIDLMYLHYLPCAEIFISGDNVHKLCAPEFMRPGQSFVDAQRLKEGLRHARAHYDAFPDDVKAKGLFYYAEPLPQKDNPILAEIWDKHRPRWRTQVRTKVDLSQLTEEQKRGLADAILAKVPLQPHAVSFQRKYPAQRGGIQVVPKDIDKKGD